jgi:hypothetical protein
VDWPRMSGMGAAPTGEGIYLEIHLRRHTNEAHPGHI